jgi:L-ascorbate metabolism protein UlaG (beta-lactamase superfamily)
MQVPFTSALQALLSPRGRHRNDLSAFEAHDVRRFPERLPNGLVLEWLGTAGFRLGYEGHDLLIDPFLTRPSMLHTFGPAPLRVDRALVTRCIPAASAVLVGHTHFDHALDVPAIAEQHDCKVYGSRSLTRLMALHGAAERCVEVHPMRTYEIGPFEVTFVESRHSKLALGLAVPFDGEISCDHLDDLRGSQYRCGDTYGIHIRVAGTTFYHQGSANLLDDRILHRGVDYFLAGVSGRGFTPDYTARILRKLEPHTIIAHHFDNFFRPLEAPTLDFSLNVNLGGFMEEVHRVSTDFRVRTLVPLTPWCS